MLPAAGLTDGVAVICGTGSVAVGSFAGRMVQIGGWGYLLGDEGGGYWVVREALRVLLDRRDQARPPGQLGGELLAATGSENLAALHRLVYEQPHRPSGWARHAGLVLDSADPAAAAIAARAADAVAGLAAAATRELDPPAACRSCWPAACSATRRSAGRPARPSHRRCPGRRSACWPTSQWPARSGWPGRPCPAPADRAARTRYWR